VGAAIQSFEYVIHKGRSLAFAYFVPFRGIRGPKSFAIQCDLRLKRFCDRIFMQCRVTGDHALHGV
jgi:hypothetical protein